MIILAKAPFTQRWHSTAPHSTSYFFLIKYFLFMLSISDISTKNTRQGKKNFDFFCLIEYVYILCLTTIILLGFIIYRIVQDVWYLKNYSQMLWRKGSYGEKKGEKKRKFPWDNIILYEILPMENVDEVKLVIGDWFPLLYTLPQQHSIPFP